MCQLIYKPAGFTIEKRLIESTCIVNPDGFGLMYYDNDTKDLKTFKLYNGDNDPEVLYPILEGLHDQDVFIHFRYRTKGEINEASCHPFLAYDDNDRKVYLMHNGTITGYGSTTKVDSEEFAEKLVGPLYDKWLKSGVRQPLQDLFFHEIVQKFIGSDSKVALLDSAGDSLIFNYVKGDVRKDKVQDADGNEKEIEWWVSNTYSFNTSHRKSYQHDYSAYRHGGTQNNGTTPFREQQGQTSHGGTTTTGNSTTTTTGGSGSTGVNQNTIVGNPPGTKSKDASTRSGEKEKGSVPKRTLVPSYWQDVLGLESIEDLAPMTRDHISDLVDLEPENAKLLINDLLIHLFEDMPYEDEVDEEEDS